ncbi:MAG TPA: peptidoglycan DD-metalloendopeptidase family protein [Casimicrobiaceae bacterium]|jgi:lipoprotein NlpD|nr:peptidoglycan DD-metalloendopeptidase family protein [Casimicrobiaceae bacterium]
MIDRARSQLLPFAIALAIAGVLAGCMTRRPAIFEHPPFVPAEQAPPPAAGLPGREPEPAPPPTYTVKRGDTLYQIALDHGLDYRELAAWNNIENVNVIRVGQQLLLAPPGGGGAVATAPLVTAAPVTATPSEARPPPLLPQGSGRPNTPTFKTEPRAIKLPYSEQALAQLQHLAPAVAEARAPAAAPPPSAANPDSGRVPEIDNDNLGWIWPATGKVVAGFSESANLKGIDIAGKAGQPVLASAAGKVVYAGTGLRGYGKLIIVKHNNTFLSAYAHNREIAVKEGQQVAKGQKIAEMGDTDAEQVMLHFEIRRLGKPVDPAKFLPPA